MTPNELRKIAAIAVLPECIRFVKPADEKIMTKQAAEMAVAFADALAERFENGEEPEELKIKKGEWYCCTQDMKDGLGNTVFTMGNLYESCEDGYLLDNYAHQSKIDIIAEEYFKLVETETAEINTNAEMGMKESKFNVDDWIVNKDEGLKYHVRDVSTAYYTLTPEEEGKAAFMASKDEVDETFRIWTIHDAKEGDIIVDNDQNIGLFKVCSTLKSFPTWESYFYIGMNHIYRTGGVHLGTESHPATLEQRKHLNEVLCGSGYWWDNKCKTLCNKRGEQKPLSPQEAMDIAVEKCFEQGEQKPAEWSKLNEDVLDALIRRLEGEDIYVSPHLAAECLKFIKRRMKGE